MGVLPREELGRRALSVTWGEVLSEPGVKMRVDLIRALPTLSAPAPKAPPFPPKQRPGVNSATLVPHTSPPFPSPSFSHVLPSLALTSLLSALQWKDRLTSHWAGTLSPGGRWAIAEVTEGKARGRGGEGERAGPAGGKAEGCGGDGEGVPTSSFFSHGPRKPSFPQARAHGRSSRN